MKDFDRLFAQSYKHLNPGGWAEFQSIELNCFCDDDSRQKAAAWVRWSENLHRAARTFGKNMRTVRTWPDKMRDAGFRDVRSVAYPVSLTCLFPFLLILNKLTGGIVATIQPVAQRP